ncbi:MAG: tRNA (guanine(26)-N(2))-dimethyltransferase [Halobacteriales archaeon]|nr:tRNA (guanine(26)-N(2))-dimethyltransferase [Halobacteriales archaeon]
MQTATITEGGLTVRVPEGATESDGKDGSVFFNPNQELNRDLTVAVLRAFQEREPAAQTYLDAMTATGIRGVRAAADGWTVTCCDVDPEAVELGRANFRANDLRGAVRRRDANVELHRNHYDVVDLDPFGTPIPFVDAAFQGTGQLLCVTATDTAPLCGAHFESGVRTYSGVPRNTEYHPEMGVRILLSALARTGARYDVGITPVVTHATRHYVRTYLRLDRSATAANGAIDALGQLHHCPECLYREPEDGLIAHPPDVCPNCGSDQLLTAGPVWLAPIRDAEFLASVEDAIDESMGAAQEARSLCRTLAAELDTPTHYDQHRLCKRWSRSANAMEEFLADLRAAGHEASRAHYGGTTFKTTADVAAIKEATGGT